MSVTTEQERDAIPGTLCLDAPESRLPLERGSAPDLPELAAGPGPGPFALRFLTPVGDAGTGGVLPQDIGYDEMSQTGTYEGLPPGVFMTKNPPKTFGPTDPGGQLDAPDDPGPSDD
ncbi:hypothetical protein GCM10009716_08850 [Streptomyces sodiiphilus]|uniref:ATP-grasp-modified RiPP n=1 Tax=Streptomyces sodiiphilus TaxID=226217 RepID=A0ABN2NTL2_9ACTN